VFLSALDAARVSRLLGCRVTPTLRFHQVAFSPERPVVEHCGSWHRMSSTAAHADLSALGKAPPKSWAVELGSGAYGRRFLSSGDSVSLSGLRPFDSEARDPHRQALGPSVRNQAVHSAGESKRRRSGREAYVCQRLSEYWRGTRCSSGSGHYRCRQGDGQPLTEAVQ
jgi:hypothetical protein